MSTPFLTIYSHFTPVIPAIDSSPDSKCVKRTNSHDIQLNILHVASWCRLSELTIAYSLLHTPSSITS